MINVLYTSYCKPGMPPFQHLDPCLPAAMVTPQLFRKLNLRQESGSNVDKNSLQLRRKINKLCGCWWHTKTGTLWGIGLYDFTRFWSSDVLILKLFRLSIWASLCLNPSVPPLFSENFWHVALSTSCRVLPANDDQWYVEDPFDLKHNLAGVDLMASGTSWLRGSASGHNRHMLKLLVDWWRFVDHFRLGFIVSTSGAR